MTVKNDKISEVRADKDDKSDKMNKVEVLKRKFENVNDKEMNRQKVEKYIVKRKEIKTTSPKIGVKSARKLYTPVKKPKKKPESLKKPILKKTTFTDELEQKRNVKVKVKNLIDTFEENVRFEGQNVNIPSKPNLLDDKVYSSPIFRSEIGGSIETSKEAISDGMKNAFKILMTSNKKDTPKKPSGVKLKRLKTGKSATPEKSKFLENWLRN